MTIDVAHNPAILCGGERASATSSLSASCKMQKHVATSQHHCMIEKYKDKATIPLNIHSEEILLRFFGLFFFFHPTSSCHVDRQTSNSRKLPMRTSPVSQHQSSTRLDFLLLHRLPSLTWCSICSLDQCCTGGLAVAEERWPSRGIALKDGDENILSILSRAYHDGLSRSSR